MGRFIRNLKASLKSIGSSPHSLNHTRNLASLPHPGQTRRDQSLPYPCWAVLPRRMDINHRLRRYGNRSLRFRSRHAGSVIAPVSDIAIRIDQGEFEQTIPIKGFAVNRDLTRIIENGRNGIHRKGEKKEKQYISD